MSQVPAYRIEFHHLDGILQAFVTGPQDTLEVSLAYWTDIAAECAISQVTHLLVVEELGTRATRGDMQEMVEVLAQIGFRDICIAYVDSLDDDDVRAAAEMHGRRVGLVGRIFRERQAGLDWLRSCEVPARDAHAGDGMVGRNPDGDIP